MKGPFHPRYVLWGRAGSDHLGQPTDGYQGNDRDLQTFQRHAFGRQHKPGPRLRTPKM